MEIIQVENADAGYFQARNAGNEAGKMIYTLSEESKLIIEHTEVKPEYAGQGIGKKMLLQLVENARSRKLKIVPLCPFAKAIFDKTKNIRDVLFKKRMI